MPYTLLDPSSAIAMPWKNGGGSTLELAICPVGASLDDFDWRISSASVASSGAFSRFPGI
ncbi:HutD family protein, partial [Bowmanella yangjiangensis]|nr:HutD family protein [Bowmanella yangjiangensis]